MSQALTRRPETVACPECNAPITVSFTAKRQRLLEELASGRHATIKAAADAAQVTPEHAYNLLGNPSYALAVSKAHERQLDKARDSLTHVSAVQQRLLKKFLELDPDQIDFATAAGSLKILQEYREKELKIREMIGDDAGDAAQRAAREAWVGHLRRAVELAGGTWDDAIPERIESGADPQDVVDPR